MNYLDLFSGIGGFALGAYWAGMKFDRHYFSEVEPYAVELYQKRFPDAIALGDIKEVDCGALMDDSEGQRREDGTTANKGPTKGNVNASRNASDIRAAWIITGGFPCQDISVAGKGEGIRGERSGLWFEYWRIIRDLRPVYCIMENVGALTFRGLDTVLGSLAEIGYDAEWQDIRAEDVGAPHRRERIWIVAYHHSTGLEERRRTEPVRAEQPAAECVCESSNATSPRLPNRSEVEVGKPGTIEEPQRSSRGSAKPTVRCMANGLPYPLGGYK